MTTDLITVLAASWLAPKSQLVSFCKMLRDRGYFSPPPSDAAIVRRINETFRSALDESWIERSDRIVSESDWTSWLKRMPDRAELRTS